MKSEWIKYLFYSSIVVVVGFLLFETVKLKNTGFEGKTLWDWMELLIIPLSLLIGGYILNRSERDIERQRAEERAILEREIATDRQQEAALQAYLDRISELLLNENLRNSENEEVRNVARVRTLTALRGLDEKRKGLVIKFLSEAELLSQGKRIINLSGADLSRVNLTSANLNHTDLSDADLSNASLNNSGLTYANLSGANLRGVMLERANMLNARLSEVNLTEANLTSATMWAVIMEQACLINAKLINADMRATSLLYADLTSADLDNANLTGANLESADFTKANLHGAIVTNEQLETAKSLKGATMPDGTIHE